MNKTQSDFGRNAGIQLNFSRPPVQTSGQIDLGDYHPLQGNPKSYARNASNAIAKSILVSSDVSTRIDS